MIDRKEVEALRARVAKVACDPDHFTHDYVGAVPSAEVKP